MGFFDRITGFMAAKPKSTKEKETVLSIDNRLSKGKDPDYRKWENFLSKNRGTLKEYKRMATEDAQIKAALALVTNSIMSKQPVIRPASDSDGDKEVAEFIEHVLKSMKTPMRVVMRDMLTALPYGFSVGEIIFTYDQIEGRVIWDGIKGVHIDTLDDCFEYDDYGELIKIEQHLEDGTDIPIPPEKCMIYSHDMEFGEREGHSIFEAMYEHWFAKKKVYQWYHIYLQKLQMPFLHGKINNPYDKSAMKEALNEIREGRTHIITGGEDEVNVVETKNHGEGFLEAVRHHDVMMFRRMGIGTLLFGLDLTSGSYAQSKTHDDVLNIFLEGVQEDIAGVFQQKFRELIDYNFVVEDYPHFGFEPFTEEDILGLLTALQAYAKYDKIDTNSEWFHSVVKDAVERNSTVMVREEDKTRVAAPQDSSVVDSNEDVGGVDEAQTDNRGQQSPNQPGNNRTESNTAQAKEGKLRQFKDFLAKQGLISQ